MTEMKFKIYLNAYLIRINRGEKLEDIDRDYLNLKKLTKADIEKIHKKINE